ncbi:MAG: pyruvate dehydrogenase complex dihydrolipoamide acetyltransferase [Deltaproteobacteria bacterium]|nr:pyruvate dehydrogenase complex dihydrolipoamide acetyltransferase [Deltaproteobacteria bacterium]MBT8465990.1 pyruvate dehydrogenase complex dihydrolipoamide acetyltransferase [Deltaproteobacteria bacterium]
MAKIIGLPKLSPTMEEGTLVAWIKKEGEKVEVDDLLAEVETDKATMEFRSFDRGVLLKILVAEGETLEPDVPVAIIGKAGEDVSGLIAEVEAGAASKPAPESASAPVSAPESESAPESAQVSAPAPASVRESAPTTEPGGRVLSSPLVRRLARERSIDLRTVQGSGPRGRIIKRDLDSYEEGAAISFSSSAERLPPRVVKASSMRRTIARRLTESMQTAPHYYLSIDVDIAPLSDARKGMNAELEAVGKRVSLNDLIIKAAAVALRRVPEVNASWMGKEIHYHQVVDISVAVAVEDGLMTPVVRDADRKGIAQISEEVRDLAERARDKKLQPEDMSNGTFSISNLGMFGIEAFTAVINPPEGAILAVGTIRHEPVVADGAVVPGRRMRFTLSCDHRLIDGATGAKFMAEFKRIAESPLSMLL